MSIGFHAHINEKDREPFYLNLRSAVDVVRCDDLSDVEGVITFPGKRPHGLRSGRITFYIIRAYGDLEEVTAYKEGFIYNKQNDYLVMFMGVKILYLYGKLHKDAYCKNVSGMYTDLAKNHNKDMTDLFEHFHIDRERPGCGCYRERKDTNSPFIAVNKSNCKRCNELGVTL